MMAFQKMRQNLHYMGAAESPFVPQSAGELAALKITMAEERRAIISRKVDVLTAQLAKKMTGQAETEAAVTKQGHALYFSDSGPFDSKPKGKRVNSAAWPSIVQLKEEGDRRAAGSSRRLPTPRQIYGKGRGKREGRDVVLLGTMSPDEIGREDKECGDLREEHVPYWLREIIGNGEGSENV